MATRTETIDVVVSIDVLVNDGDDDAMTLLGGLIAAGGKAEVTAYGFGFDGKITRVATPGRI